MTQATRISRPGRELQQFERDLCKRLVSQGWSYLKPAGTHAAVITPDGLTKVPISTSPSEYRGRRNLEAQVKRLGADLSSEPVKKRRPATSTANPDENVVPPPHAPSMDVEPEGFEYTLVGNRRRNGYYLEPEPTPEPVRVIYRKVCPYPPRPDIPADAKGEGHTLGEARRLIRDGYHLHRVMKLTGWGSYWLDDLVNPDTGYLNEVAA